MFIFGLIFINLIQCGIKNEKEYQKTRELIADQKLSMEKGLVRFRISNDLLKYNGKILSIFKEETKDTTFMCKYEFKKTFFLTKIISLANFY